MASAPCAAPQSTAHCGFCFQQTVNQSGGKGIASATRSKISNFRGGASTELAVGITNRSQSLIERSWPCAAWWR